MTHLSGRTKILYLIGLSLLIGVGILDLKAKLLIAASSQSQKLVRVAILKDKEEFVISIRGHYQICPATTEDCLEQNKVLPNAKVTTTATGIKIADKE